MIEKREWKSTKPLRRLPKLLKWPDDIMEAVNYDMAAISKSKKGKRSKVAMNHATPKLRRDILPCSAQDCPTPKPRRTTPESLCNCTVAPWDLRNTFEWFKSNIELRAFEGRDIGTVALTPLTHDIVIGEYVGELVPFDPNASTVLGSEYIFDIAGNDGVLALIDGGRMSSWTRFINHSCRPSMGFDVIRVGRRIKMCVVAVRDIEVGEEITDGYGKGYWKEMMRRGLFCG